MNTYQKRLLAVLAVNVVIVLLFPPFDSLAIGSNLGQVAARGTSTFDAFYFVLDRQANKVVNTDLLLLEIGWIALNGAIGWMLLRDYRAPGRIMSAGTAVLHIFENSKGIINDLIRFMTIYISNKSRSTRVVFKFRPVQALLLIFSLVHRSYRLQRV